MTQGPMPVGPRPLPGEAIRSWVSRTGTRYGLTTSELLALLRAGIGVEHSRLWALDWQEDVELEALLTRASRLDAGRIKALRALADGWPDPADWHRWALAWCPACVREDLVRHGESYERAAWRLGFYVICPEHQAALVTACPGCSSHGARFGPWAGRQRLLCECCREPVEAAGGDVPLGWPMAVPAVQAELLRLASGAAGVSPLWAGTPAGGCATLVRDLAALLLRPGWTGWGLARSEEEAGPIRRRGLADLQPLAARDLLGRIAAILATVASWEGHGDQQSGQRDQPGDGGFSSLVHRLSADEQDGLRASAAGWGPRLAHVIEVAVLRDQVERRRVAAAGDVARQKAAWIRQAAKRYVREARRRIATSAARRAAAIPQRRGPSQGPTSFSGPV